MSDVYTSNSGQELLAILRLTQATGGDISALPMVSFNLKSVMSRNHVTIRQMAHYGNVTMKRVRELRDAGSKPQRFLVALDYLIAAEELGAINRSRRGFDKDMRIVSGEYDITRGVAIRRAA